MQLKPRLLKSLFILGLVVLVAATGVTFAGDDAPTGDAAPYHHDSLFLMAHGALAAPVHQEDDGGESMPVQDCAECHLDVLDEWETSAHASAYDNDLFQDALANASDPDSCYACHTTGYSAATGEFTAATVNCEACHGLTPVDHPPEPVNLVVTSQLCGECHTNTFGEFEGSLHAAEGLECIDCHQTHARGILEDEVQILCINCHEGVMEADNYAHASHKDADLTCASCHLFMDPAAPVPETGLGHTGHGFETVTRACLSCHAELDEDFDGVPVENATATELRLQISELQSELAQFENSAGVPFWLLALASSLGFVVGIGGMWFVATRLRNR